MIKQLYTYPASLRIPHLALSINSKWLQCEFFPVPIRSLHGKTHLKSFEPTFPNLINICLWLLPSVMLMKGSQGDALSDCSKLINLASAKSLQIINEGVEKKEPSYTVGGNVNRCSHYGEQYRSSLKIRVTVWSSSPTPGHVSEKNKNSNLKRYMHPSVHSNTIYNI